MKKSILLLTAAILLSAARAFAQSARPIEMVPIPGKNYKISKTEVTQDQYQKVMGENPSWFQVSNSKLSEKERNALEKEGDSGSNPVEQVSWYDAIYFCNKLSEKEGLEPVYAVDGKTDVSKWDYRPHNMNKIAGNITQNTKASGYRLPTNEEWEHAAKGGEDYEYSGSDNLDEVGWYYDNSGDMTHPVAQKKANGYGLYEMTGNVWEWVWDAYDDDYYSYYRGGGCYSSGSNSEVSNRCYISAFVHHQFCIMGFRLLVPIK